MSKKRFDHYLPQFLLKGFRTNGTKHGIYCYRRGEEPEQRNIRKTAGIKDFELLTDGNPELRDKLHDLDNKWADFLGELEGAEDISSLLAKHGSTFAEFVAFQILRTPIWRNRLCAERNAKKEARGVLEQSKKDYVQRLLKGGASPQGAKQMADSAYDLPFRLHATDDSLSDHDYYIKRVLEEAPTLAAALSKRKWVFLTVAEVGGSFVTSDAPVLTHSTQAFQLDLIQTAVTAVLYIPINKYMAVLSSPIGFTRHMKLGIPTERVDALNSWMIENAYIEVYSHQKTEKVQEAFDCTSKKDVETFKWGWISESETELRSVEGFGGL